MNKSDNNEIDELGEILEHAYNAGYSVKNAVRQKLDEHYKKKYLALVPENTTVDEYYEQLGDYEKNRIRDMAKYFDIQHELEFRMQLTGLLMNHAKLMTNNINQLNKGDSDG